MMLLALSLLALPLGPLLAMALGRAHVAFVALDAFVVVAITGLVMLHIVPESVAFAGWPALCALMVGLGLPALLHGATDNCHNKRSGGLFIALALGALGLHALLDGVALVPVAGGDSAALDVAALGAPLALSVLLHRLLEGVGIWWLTGDRTPTTIRVGALLAVGAMTVAGFASGAWAVQQGALQAIACVQTVVAGSLLHVLMRHGPTGHGHDHGHRKHTLGMSSPMLEKAASALGGLLGALVLWALHVAERSHHHHHGVHQHTHEALDSTAYLQMLGARIGPAVLAALGLAAVMHMLVPQWHSPARGAAKTWAAILGTVQGLLLAPCSCGVVPLYRRLLRQRAPDAQALAYLLAAPGLGLVTLCVSWAVLGPWLTVVRVGGALALSVTVAWATPAPQLPEPAAQKSEGGHRHGSSFWRRGMDGLSFAMGEVADFTGPWLLFGLLAATLCSEGLDPAWLGALSDVHLTVPVLALLALPLYLCGSASTLIAAVLLGKGVSFGGALTFLWAASMLSPAAMSAVRERYGRGLGSTVVARTACAVMLAGALSEVLGQTAYVQNMMQQVPMAPEHQPLSVAAYALWALLAWAIVRQGVRESVDQIALLNRNGTPSHHHGSVEWAGPG